MKSNTVAYIFSGVTAVLLAGGSFAFGQVNTIQLAGGEQVVVECLVPEATATETSEPTATQEATATGALPTVTSEPTDLPTATATIAATVTPTQAAGGGYIFTDGETKIMLVGDSITRGESQSESYRYHLWNLLQAAGYTQIDFVGAEERPDRAVKSGGVDGTWDYDHSSFAGSQPDFIYQIMQFGQNAVPGNWAATYQPDIVLIHLGTNGHLPNHTSDLSQADGDYLAIINEFRSANPNTVFFVSKIMGKAVDNQTWLASFNNALDGFAAANSTAQSPIIIVDNSQAVGFSTAVHTIDGTHLNEAGAALMAQQWFDALTGE